MKRLYATTLAAAIAASFAGAAIAADHLDSPITKNDPAADITDIYAFVNPKDPTETILVTDVVPLATSNSRFSDKVDYIVHVDNGSGDQAITCRFPELATRVQCSGPGGLTASGALNQVNQGQNMRVFAGLADDPFYFDFTAFIATKETLTPQFHNPGTNFFKNLNVLTIVLGVKSSALTNDGAKPVLKVYGSTKRIGGAGLNGGFTGSWFDPANSGHGFTLQVLPPFSGGVKNLLYVLWNVYDASGRQSWITGVGEINGSHADVTDAYTTSNGAFPPHFSPGMPTLNRWGTLSFDFTTCNSGSVHYNGSMAGLGSGDIPLTRLTQIEGQSCSLLVNGQIDRMGRPGINTVLIDLLAPHVTTLKDAYNRAEDPSAWQMFAAEMQKNLAALDTLDGVTGNNVLPPAQLAPVLADDRLIIDVSKPMCDAYLAVELGVTTQCGGRTFQRDVIDDTLGAIVGPGVSDFVAGDSTYRSDFPFIGVAN